MDLLRITLFRKFGVRYNEQVLGGCDGGKMQELFCYLLLNRDRPHAREVLSSLLWRENCTTAQAKKYLRHTLWQIHTFLKSISGLDTNCLLVIEPEWIQLHSTAGLWLDVSVFEETYGAVKGVWGCHLTEKDMQALDQAVRLYEGNLLENWYQDWCMFERERLFQIYLILLDKIIDYCEEHQRFEDGLIYGQRVLYYDRARERTHRQMMRLYYAAGHRTGALRQYERCAAALKEELDIAPSDSTTKLYEEIRGHPPSQPSLLIEGNPAPPELDDVLQSLHQLQTDLAHMQHRVGQVAKSAASALRDTASSFQGQQRVKSTRGPSRLS